MPQDQAVSDLGQMTFNAEATPGSTPVTAPTALRVVKPSLTGKVNTRVSSELTGSRMDAHATTTDVAVSGGFDCEVSPLEYDPFIAGVLATSFVHFGATGKGTAFSMATTSTTITASAATSGTSLFTRLSQGQWFKLVAPPEAAANVKDYFARTWLQVSKVVAPTSTVITLSTVTPLSGVGLIAVTTPGYAISSSVASNGDTPSFFSMQWAQADASAYVMYRGWCADSMSLTYDMASALTASFSGIGMDFEAKDTSMMTGVVGASQDFDAFDCATDLSVLLRDGTSALSGTGDYLRKLTVDVKNNAAARPALGYKGAVGVALRSFGVSGTVETYLEASTEYTRMRAGDYFPMVFGVADKAGHGYLVELPRCMLTDVTANTAKGSDVTLSLPYTAFNDAASGFGIRVTRATI